MFYYLVVWTARNFFSTVSSIASYLSNAFESLETTQLTLLLHSQLASNILLPASVHSPESLPSLK